MTTTVDDTSTGRVSLRGLLRAAVARPHARDTPTPDARRFGHLRNFLRGLVQAPDEYRDWKLVTELDAGIRGLEASGDHAKAVAARDKQLSEQAKRRERVKPYKREAWIAAVGVVPGGWVWMTVAAGLALLAALALKKKGSAHGLVVERLAEIFAISMVLQVLLAVAGVHPAPLDSAGLHAAYGPGNLVPPLLAAGLVALLGGTWLWHHTKDDGTIADDLRMVPTDPADPDYGGGAILDAVAASEAKLAKDAKLAIVAPGITTLAGGTIWKATLDTGGPSAEPILSARDDIASRLGLSESRLIVERNPGYGRRVCLTGVVGNPWGPPTRSPLLDVQRFAFGTDPLPYGMDIERNPVELPIVEMHYLVGGMPRRGKSTSCYPIWVAAALDPWAPIWVIDGGEVDTAVLQDAGLTRRWTADPNEAFDVLSEVEEEVERRQSLLRAAGLKRPNGEFYAEHDMSDGLVAFDEFATFTTHPDTALAKKISKLLVSLLQRSPKSSIHFVLSTQSPSSNAFDTDGRGVVPGRIALLCDSSDMSDKVLGRYTAARLGIDASRLPAEQDKKGVQWLRTHEGARVVRPHLIDDDQMRTLIERARQVRASTGAVPEVPTLLTATADLLRARGVESMRSAEVVGRLRDAGHPLPGGLSGQQTLAAALAPHGVCPAMVRADGNLKHYLATDLQAAVERAGRGGPRRLRVV